MLNGNVLLVEQPESFIHTRPPIIRNRLSYSGSQEGGALGKGQVARLWQMKADKHSHLRAI